MNTTAKYSLLLLTGAALLTACGRADVNAQNAPPSQLTTGSPSPTSTPVGASSWKSGVYVASYDGKDSNPGTPQSPVQTIDQALTLAHANNLSDIYLFGDGFNGSYQEIVVLQQPTSIHGSLCHSAPMVVDTANCPTTIAGGSPSVIIDHVNSPMTIENVTIVGADSAQNDGSSAYYFELPTIGCIGRGVTPMSAGYRSCQNGPGLDPQGRTIPQSSMAVAMIASSRVVFNHDTIRAGNAASGLPGLDGANGTGGGRGHAGGSASATDPTVGGAGGAGGVNPDCSDANGGAGGVGGHYSTIVTKVDAFGRLRTNSTGFDGENGSAVNSTVALAAGAPFVWSNQVGANGEAGQMGPSSKVGNDGNLATTDVDLSLLVAGSGSNGEDGFDGLGGSGGGGGAAGTIILSEKRDSSGNLSTSGSWFQYSVSGGSGDNSSYSYTAGHGETPAGGGGGGGAGGCGGKGGIGGQGGASSVGLYLSQSAASFPGSTIIAGNGGNGGEGGKGGAGGLYGAHGDAGNGGWTKATTETDTTTQDTTGGFSYLFGIGSHFSVTYQSTVMTSISESHGGQGGIGGDGQDGGAGGHGAGGAGGASIGILVKGATPPDLTDATVVLDTPGLGGGPNGKTGLNTNTYSVN